MILGKKIKLNHDIISVDLPLFVGAALLIYAISWDGKMTMAEGLVCLTLFTIYIIYAISESRKKEYKEFKEELAIEHISRGKKPTSQTYLILAMSLVFIFFGAKYTVDSVIQLSRLLGIGTEIIAASAVALGTSLPELTVSIGAARKGTKANWPSVEFWALTYSMPW